MLHVEIDERTTPLVCCPEKHCNNGNVDVSRKRNGKRLFHFTVCFFFVRIMAASTKDDMDRIGLFKEMEYVTIKDPYKETAKCKSVENFMHEHVTWRFVFFL